MPGTGKRPIAVDLFAGAGGLSLGAEMAGVQVKYATDIWPAAADTYAWNHPGATFHRGPIEELTAEHILTVIEADQGEVDLLLGGPPCQGFSIYAPARSGDDQRNALVLEYLRIVEGLLPKYLVIENVPGLLSLEGGRTLHAVYERLHAIGYAVDHRVLLAARYGVPQERWRLIILGRRSDMPDVGFPPPTHHATARANFTGGAKWMRHASAEEGDAGDLPPAVTIQEAIGDLPVLQNGDGSNNVPMPRAGEAPLSSYQHWAREGTDTVWNHVAPKLSKVNLERLRYIAPGGNWTDIPFELLPSGMKRARRSDHTKRYGRMDPRKQSCTILTKCDPHWGSFFHYQQDRAITPREAARLQSFPDRYVFTGTQSAQYEQIGNAVPPLLARAVVAPIIRILADLPSVSREAEITTGVR